MSILERRLAVPFGLLATPAYLRLWTAGALSNAMRWLELLVAGIFTYDLTGSPVLVAAVTVARALPMMLIGAFAGVVAESVNRKTLLVGGLVAMGVNAAVLWALAATGQIAVWHLICGGALAGIVWASEMAVRRRMVGEVVDAGRVGPAIALDTVTGSFTRMVGPLVGGALFDVVGLTGAYLLSAGLYFLAASIVVGLDFRQDTRRLHISRIPADLVEGLLIVRRHATIRSVVLITIVMNVFAFSYSALIAPIGVDKFAVSPTLIGLLAAAEPAGAILSGLARAAGWLRGERITAMLAGSYLFLAVLIGAALVPWYAAAFVLLFVGGFGTAIFGSMQSTIILTDAPPASRSRIMGIITVSIGMGPVGVMGVGFASEQVGASMALVGMAAIGILALVMVSFGAPTGPRHR